MHARKQLDIGFDDLLSGAMACGRPLSATQLNEQIAQHWGDSDDTLTALSVRTAFDAWLTVLNLPRGCEVVKSGINIPDMGRILEHHDLKIVPVDLDVETLEISSTDLEAAITPRTRLILVAYLFGARSSMDPVFEVAGRHPHIQVAEDCAQAFTGTDDYRGDPRSDISLFSFGAIKTATALGGALVRIKDAQQRAAVCSRLATYPRDGRFYFFRRTLKFLLLKILALRFCYAAFVKSYAWMGLNFDEVIVHAVRGFSGPNLIPQLHRQPALPLLALMNRRLSRYTRSQLDHRCHNGNLLNQALPAPLRSAGYRNPHHTWWLFPVTTPKPDGLVQAMQRGGFDATATSTQLTALAGKHGPAPQCARFMKQTVYLPLQPSMSEATIKRMAAVVQAHYQGTSMTVSRKEVDLIPVPTGK